MRFFFFLGGVLVLGGFPNFFLFGVWTVLVANEKLLPFLVVN